MGNVSRAARASQAPTGLELGDGIEVDGAQSATANIAAIVARIEAAVVSADPASPHQVRAAILTQQERHCHCNRCEAHYGGSGDAKRVCRHRRFRYRPRTRSSLLTTRIATIGREISRR